MMAQGTRHPGGTVVRLLALAVALALLAGCGGDGAGEHDSRALELYEEYRSTEDTRDGAEARLREAFTAIGRAAQAEDRDGVLAAAADGRTAAEDIRRLLGVEIAAAGELAGIDGYRVEAGRLRTGLETTREGLGLFEEQLALALEDPFLRDAANAERIDELAVRAADLSTEGELAVRRADRRLAVALGLPIRPDAFLDD